MYDLILVVFFFTFSTSKVQSLHAKIVFDKSKFVIFK